MQSNTVKQIIICFIILIVCGVGAFLIKGYVFEDDNEFSNEIVIKDKYEYNEYQLSNVTNETLIQRYFIDFKEKMLTSTDEAYKLLDSDTKEKYETYYDFKDYIDSNIEQLRTSYIVKYNIQKSGSTTNYIVVDQFDNKYTFMSKAVLLYTVNFELYDENSSIFE